MSQFPLSFLFDTLEVSSIQVTLHTSHQVFPEFSECKRKTSFTHVVEGIAVDWDLL